MTGLEDYFSILLGPLGTLVLALFILYLIVIGKLTTENAYRREVERVDAMDEVLESVLQSTNALITQSERIVADQNVLLKNQEAAMEQIRALREAETIRYERERWAKGEAHGRSS